MEEKQKGMIYTVATAHLDTVWNWSLKDTIRYHIPRTLRENFALMDAFPTYKFNFEGAYRYRFIEEYYPAQFEQLKEYAARGQWIPAGAALENGDCNIPSPEALLRNFLYGNRYFAEKLGRRSKDVFLPDCFGFGYALPTVARHANLIGFSTQKLSYGPAQPVPFDIGRWYGVDGKFLYACLKMGPYETAFRRVRTHPELLRKLQENGTRYGLPVTAAYHGATGDKGGAPKESSVAVVAGEEQENAREPIQVISAASDALAVELERRLTKAQKQRLPRWNGELLLRRHAPGAYTSRTASKRLNRRCEVLADTAERAAAAAFWLGEAYPYETLRRAYERVIVHQFHDDLTGTAILSEYERSWNDYFLSLNELKSTYEGSIAALAGQMDTSWVTGEAVVVHNPLETARAGVVEIRLPAACGEALQARDAGGTCLPVQVIRREGEELVIALRPEVPPLGMKVYDICPARKMDAKSSALRITKSSLENQRYRVTLNRGGDIESILDKAQGDRELLERPIRLEILRHTGSRRYPAWEMRYEEVSAFPRTFVSGGSTQIVENGPVRVTLRVTREADGSRFTQYISLEDGGDVLRVENEVDWYSKESLLKVSFPFKVSCENALYDLGWGAIARPVSSPALFEVPAQRYADVTERDASFGVSVFSDSRTGWDHPDANTLRLTAVATPKRPFRKESRQDLMDFGCNRFGFGVYSHVGAPLRSAPFKAQAFLQPMTAFHLEKHTGTLGGCFSFGSLSTQGVELIALKRAEEEPDALVVRVCECGGVSHSGVRLRLGDGILEAAELYGSEEPLGLAAVEEGELLFDITPFTPKTFLVRLKPPAVSLPKMRQEALRLPYDRTTVTFHDSLGAGVLRERESFAGEILPEAVQCGGVTFQWGKAIAREKNALACRGQELSVPAGFETLSLLVTSAKGDREAVFTVDNSPVKRMVPDCGEAIGAWDLIALGKAGYVKECTVAYAATHTHGRFGDYPGERLYLFQINIPVPKQGAVLTLPQDEQILLFAATLTAGREALHAGSPLYDRLNKRAVPQMFEKTRLFEALRGKGWHV